MTASAESPLWSPSPAEIEATNVAAFARDVGLGSWKDLHAWSVAHRADFWSAIAGRLGIAFRKPADTVLEDSGGPERARWWPGAELNIVDSCFRQDPDRVALVHDVGGELQSVSYGALEGMVSSLATRFEPGERIGIVAPMTLETVATYLAVIRAGATAVSVAESFSAAEIRKRLRIGRARTVVTQESVTRDGRVHPLLERVIEAGAERAVVARAPGREAAGLRPQDVDWADLLASGPDRSATASPADAPINILFSSGTTADPKAIPWTQLTPIKSAMDAHLHMDVGPGDVLCWPTSLGWMMGPWLIFASLINGAALALHDDAPTTASFGRFVEDAGVTLLGVVPSLVASWRASGCMAGAEWSAVRRFASTGEASHPADMRYLSDLAGGRPVLEYCGGTEIGGAYVTSTLAEPSWPSELTTPAFGLDFEILDPGGRPADEGEIFLVGPSVGLSARALNADHHAVYYEGVPRPGLRRHGDYFARLPRGTYRARGRCDDTMNLGGIKVSSAELEQAVRALPGVRDAAAVAAAAADGGPDRLAFFIVPGQSAERTPEVWREHAQRAVSMGLNPLFRVWRVELVDVLPRTASNKVMRRELRARLGRRGGVR